jgi:predicted PurR-regulated permease PerM
VLQDPNLQTTLTEYGFTSQFVKDRVQDGQYYLDNWLQSNNVNITSIYNLFSKQNSTTSIVNSMQKDHWQFLQSLLKIDTTPVRRVGTFFLQTGFDFLWVMGSFFGSFYNFVTYLLVFLACLYYLLQSDTFFIEYIAAILPIHNQSKSNFVDTLTKSINGIFVGSFLVCISHGLITYFFFYLLDLNYIYVATFITAFTALFPFVSSSLIFVPVLFVLRLKENPLWWYYVVAYAVSQFFLLWILEPFIYRRIPASHPYLTGIAIVLGWSAFGFEGVFLGPMLIVFTITAYDLFQSNKNIALNTSRHRRKKRKVSSGRYYGLSPSASMDHNVETKL